MDVRDRTSVSRIYQYRAVDGGSRYELSTELEGPGDRYAPTDNRDFPVFQHLSGMSH